MSSNHSLIHRIFLAPLLASMLLAGCGGGGGSTSDNSADLLAPAPSAAPDSDSNAVATESPPVGPVVDIGPLNLLPLSAADSWRYDIADENGTLTGTGKREAVAYSGDTSSANVKLLETEDGETTTTVLAKQTNGLFANYALDSSLPQQTARQIGLVREYAVPAYAIGEKRIVFRQGVWDEDIDADQKPEQFQIEYTQVFQGFESLALPWGSTIVARFSNAYRFTVTGSKEGEVRGVVSTEEAFLASGIGPVKFVRYAVDLQGKTVKAARTWNISTATVGGKTY